MDVNLIGTFKRKLLFLVKTSVYTCYLLDNIILKDDFDNNQINGCFGGFFTNIKDCTNFVIPGKCLSSNNDSNKYCVLTENQIELLNSLEQGDVVVLKADISMQTSYGIHEFFSYYSWFKNIEKYDDKDAAKKIRRMISKMKKKEGK